VIQDDLGIIETATQTRVGTLRTVAGHAIDAAHLDYHRERFDLLN
jgi:hypothetical protein